MLAKLAARIRQPSERLTGGLALRFSLYFVLSFSLALLVFLRGLDNYFAADDWPAILRNSAFSWQEVPTWFSASRVGWYRPVHDMFVAWNWNTFHLNLLGYRLVTLAVYASVSACVGLMFDLLTRDRRVGFFSVVLFTVFSTHAEPVLCFACTNELLAALFVLISTIAYIRYRQTKQLLLLFVAGLSSLLAYSSKETALFLPLVLVFYDFLLLRKRHSNSRLWPFLAPTVAMVSLWIGFLIFRIPMGSAYSGTVSITPLRIVKNLTYYALIAVFSLPNDYAFFDSLPQWRSSPLMPAVILVLSTSIILFIGFVWTRNGMFRQSRYVRSLFFASFWVLAALGPVILIVSERAVFLASIGIAGTYSILLVGSWDALNEFRDWQKQMVVLSFTLYLALNIYVLSYRNQWFEKSSDLNQVVLEQLTRLSNDLQADTRILIADLPDQTHHTFTFRNTFPAATELLQQSVSVVPVLDTDLGVISAQEREEYVNRLAEEADTEAIFWYDDGELVPRR